MNKQNIKMYNETRGLVNSTVMCSYMIKVLEEK